MSITMISRAGRAAVYSLADQRYGIVILDNPGRQRGIEPTAEVCSALSEALISEGILYTLGDLPVIRNGAGRIYPIHTREHLVAFVNQHLLGAVAHNDTLPPELNVPTAAQQDLDIFEEWRAICGGNNLTYTQWATGGSNLGPAFRDARIPPFRGELSHPIVGELPGGWFAPAPPAPPADYKLLLKLFSSLPLDAAGRATLYTYLLGAFHVESITSPAPLLCVDSQEQAVGKTEAVMAISTLLDQDAAPLTPPYSKDTEVLTAHFMKGCRLAPLDNLCSVKDYQHPWLASILSDRTAADRPKYGRVTVEFPGRLVCLTFILGNATLHRDFLSRAWRVELHGGGRPLAHRPNRFAKAHRAALRAQCYHAVANAPAWSARGSGTRSSEYEAIGAAAYAYITGKSQEEVSDLLRESLKRVGAYSTAFLRALKKAGAEFPDPDAVLPVQPGDPAGAQVTLLAGATGLGYRAVRTEKGLELEPYTVEVEQI